MSLSATAVGVGHPTADGGRWLYRHLTHDFPESKFSVLIGPNGSGKSTLLRQLAGVSVEASHQSSAWREGDVSLGEQSLRHIAAVDRARQVAYLPQHTPLYHDLSVRAVVMLGRSPYLHRFAPPSSTDEEAVRDALADVGAADLIDRRVMTLSGGERQRIMLARMLAAQVPLLLLDEPTTALDIGHALDFLELCRRLVSKGTTIIMAIHDLNLARRYADSAVCLTNKVSGETVRGTAAEVLSADVIGEIFAVNARPQDANFDTDLVFYPQV